MGAGLGLARDPRRARSPPGSRSVTREAQDERHRPMTAIVTHVFSRLAPGMPWNSHVTTFDPARRPTCDGGPGPRVLLWSSSGQCLGRIVAVSQDEEIGSRDGGGRAVAYGTPLVSVALMMLRRRRRRRRWRWQPHDHHVPMHGLQDRDGPQRFNGLARQSRGRDPSSPGGSGRCHSMVSTERGASRQRCEPAIITGGPAL